MSNNPYKILGIDENAEFIVIKAAYRAMANKYHPDKWQGDKKEAEKKIKEINNAYDILSDDNKRREYDNKKKSKHEKKSEQQDTDNKKNTGTNKSNQFFYPKPLAPENILPSSISNFCSIFTDKLIWIYLVINYISLFSLFKSFHIIDHFQYDSTKLNSLPQTVGAELLFIRLTQLIEICVIALLILFITITTHNYKNLIKDSFKLNILNKFFLRISQNTNFVETFYHTLFTVFSLLILVGFYDLLVDNKKFQFQILYLFPVIIFFGIYYLGMATNYTKFHSKNKISIKNKISHIILMMCPIGLFLGVPSLKGYDNHGVLIEYKLDLIHFIILIFIVRYIYKISQKFEQTNLYTKIIIYFCAIYSFMMWISGTFLEFRLYVLLSKLF